MSAEKRNRYIKLFYRSTSIYVIAAFLIQLLAIGIGLNLLWLVSVFWVVTTITVLLNSVLIVVVFILLIRDSKEPLKKPLLWMVANEFLLLFSFLVLFASVMTMPNL